MDGRYMEKWRCIVFGLNRLNGGGRSQIPEYLITDSAKIQHIDELLQKIIFLKSIMENETI